MDVLRPEQIMKILELTDSFNVHREKVLIPLATADVGSVELLPDGRLRIFVPTGKRFEEWLNELRAQLAKMKLSSALK